MSNTTNGVAGDVPDMNGYVPRKRPIPELSMLVDEKVSSEIEDLQKLTKNTKALFKNDFAAQKFLNENVVAPTEPSLDEEETLAMVVPTCRFPNIKCWKFSHVLLKKAPSVLLHISRFEDYYRQPLYLCTAPISREIPNYFSIIEQEKIGVVVWLGKSEEFTSYLPLNSGQSERHGEYLIENICVMDESYYCIHVFQVSKNLNSNWRPLQKIVLVHVFTYPIDGSSSIPEKLLEVLEVMDLYHEQQTAGHELNGILMHYISGVNCSAALCIMYIGRQLWLDTYKLNVMGIMRYVRKYRFGAFSTFATSYKQFQLIYKVLQCLATRTSIAMSNSLREKSNSFVRCVSGQRNSAASVSDKNVLDRHKDTLRKVKRVKKPKLEADKKSQTSQR